MCLFTFLNYLRNGARCLVSVSPDSVRNLVYLTTDDLADDKARALRTISGGVDQSTCLRKNIIGSGRKRLDSSSCGRRA